MSHNPHKESVAASQTATTGGRKFDGGKLLFGLLPPLALDENVKVLTFGAQKYEPDNWRRVPDGINRYFDAAQRHLWAWKKGEENDPETGLHHMAHAICCLQFICDLELAARKELLSGTSSEEVSPPAADIGQGWISGTIDGKAHTPPVVESGVFEPKREIGADQDEEGKVTFWVWPRPVVAGSGFKSDHDERGWQPR